MEFTGQKSGVGSYTEKPSEHTGTFLYIHVYKAPSNYRIIENEGVGVYIEMGAYLEQYGMYMYTLYIAQGVGCYNTQGFEA